MLYDCRVLTSLDLSNFKTSKITDMNSIFAYCEDLTSFNTAKATNRNVMFMGCKNMQQILVGEGRTEPSEADLLNMFRDCGVSDVTRPGDI